MACVSTRLQFSHGSFLFWTASIPFSPVLLGFTPFDKSHPHLLFPREAPLFFGLRVLMVWDYLLMILQSPSKESLYVSHYDICRNLFVWLRSCHKCFWGISKGCSACTIALNFTLQSSFSLLREQLYVTGNTLGLILSYSHFWFWEIFCCLGRLKMINSSIFEPINSQLFFFL